MNSAKKTRQPLGSIVVAMLLLVNLPTPAPADDTMSLVTRPARKSPAHYLTANEPDVIALLAPPPLADSLEQAADLAETVSVHEQMPPAEKAAAKLEQKFSVFCFAPVIGPIFQPGKMPKTEVFLRHVQEDADAVTDTGKNFWRRPRPYTVDPKLAKGADDLEKSFSYPSGHSTRGTVLAEVLAELFPDKKEQILAEGRAIGWRRVELGRHYPTDIYAGRVLAGAIVRELNASPDFQKDLLAATHEIALVMAAEKQAPPAMTVAAH
jgi:acid phosphatase (class A)